MQSTAEAARLNTPRAPGSQAARRISSASQASALAGAAG